MDISWSLLLWVVILIVVYFLAKRAQIATWSAFSLAVLVSWIVLMIARPANTVQWGMGSQSGLSSIYWLISVLSPIIIVVYALSKMLTDRPANTPYF